MIKIFKLKEERGFSLVELMIVVAIIAILAAIAIPSFMKFAQKSKTTEATGNLSAIRTCEESYKAENDVYLACLTCPDNADMGSKPVPWPIVRPAGWDEIGFEPDGDVRYVYAVAVSGPTVFTITAEGDLDEDEVNQIYTVEKGTAGYPKPTYTPGIY